MMPPQGVMTDRDLIKETNVALADVMDHVEALEKRVGALEDDIRRLWDHISNMPGGV